MKKHECIQVGCVPPLVARICRHALLRGGGGVPGPGEMYLVPGDVPGPGGVPGPVGLEGGGCTWPRGPSRGEYIPTL